MIADLVRRRDDVLADTEELSAKLTGAVSEHRPEPGADQFDKPDELDPLAREDAGAEFEVEDDEVEETAVEQTEVHEAESDHEADLRT